MKTLFLFTVDVETRTRGDSGRDILGALPGHRETFGIERMMDFLEGEQARGTFFLNVYEVAIHGDGVMARAATLIHSRGHDLELHTHPRPMYPYYGMSHAPFEDQLAILEKGVSLIEGWTGKRVVAHRAGAFSANLETVRAAETAGLIADSSLSPGSRVWVPLVKELGASNLARRVGNVWEIPVTHYEQVRIGRWRSRRILDLEGSSLAEIKHVTRRAIREGLPTVCLLMHSFSFSRHGRPSRRVMRRMSALLAWLRAQEQIEIATIEHACARLDPNAVQHTRSRVPCTGIWLTWCRALQAWNDGWKNFVVAGAGTACFAILILGLCYLGYALSMAAG